MYLITGLLFLLLYGGVLTILHASYPHIPKPFHVITFNIDQYYRWIYWFLIPFVLISALIGEIHTISENIKVRLNNYRRLLSFYYIQMSMVALWGTFLIGIITFICFPLAAKTINGNDFKHILGLLLFCYLNLTNIGLLLIILTKKFSEQISFFIVLLIALFDQYLFNHVIFSSTKLLYRPDLSISEFAFSILENFFLLAGLLFVLSIQIQEKVN